MPRDATTVVGVVFSIPIVTLTLASTHLITADVTYKRLIERAFEKIRQAGHGMPAVLIRQLDALAKIADHTTTGPQRELLLEQAAIILRAGKSHGGCPT